MNPFSRLTPRAGWRWRLPTMALAGLAFVLLRDRIDNVLLRGVAALVIVAIGGMLLIALAGAVRGRSDPRR